MRAAINYSPVASICVAVCLNLLLSVNALAADDAGNVLRVTGRATVTTPQGEIRQIKKGSKLNSTDMVSTSARSYVRLKMNDSSYVMVRPDSRMKIEDFKFNKKKPKENRSIFSLLKGGFRAVTGLIEDKKKYRYRTAVATIGIRGTDFSVRRCNGDCFDIDPLPEPGIWLEVHDKTIIVTNKAGEFTFTKGQFAHVLDDHTPPRLIDGRPPIFEKQIPSPETDCQE